MKTAVWLLLLVAAPAQAQFLPIERCPLDRAPERPCLWPARATARDRRAHFQLLLGAGYRMLYGLPYGVGSTSLLAGRETAEGAIFGRFDVEAGAPELGLPVGALRIGFLGEGRHGRLRLGGGVRLGLVGTLRATTGYPVIGFTFDFYGTASIDLIARKTRALFIGVEAGAVFNVFESGAPLDATADISPLVTGFVGLRR